ncbi:MULTISPECIES: hypothetical protein [Bartonella]|nr:MULTISPECIES: hypothetical protein [Bartonella]
MEDGKRGKKRLSMERCVGGKRGRVGVVIGEIGMENGKRACG